MTQTNVEVISPKHIDYILSYASECGLHIHQIENERIDRKFNCNVAADLDTLGQHLTAVNQAAVNYAYRENVPQPKYTYRNYRLSSDDGEVQVLKALDCYEYNTECLPQYKQTLSCQIIAEIRKHAITQLPGYKAADWEIAA